MAQAPATHIQNPGANQGKGLTSTDRLELFLKVFAGETLAAFSRSSLAMDKFIVRTIANGKSATFPVMGRAKAQYLPAGTSLDTMRGEIKHTEKVINIDGLLTADVLIFDLDDAMNHYDVASEYSKQVGESLAIAADGAILAELAKAAMADANLTELGGGSILVTVSKADATSPNKVGEYVLKDLANARGIMSKNYVPASDRYAFVTTDVYSAILATMQATTANFSELVDQENGSIRNVCGFTVIEVPHLTDGGADNSNTMQGTGHAFPTAASTPAAPKVTKDNVLALCAHRSSVGTVKLKDLALERARRPEFQADEIIGRYAMGHGILRPETVVALVVEDPKP